MSVTGDILAMYRAPRRVSRRLVSGGVREDRALIVLMAACALIFIAQWPRLAREAALNPDVPLDALIGAALLGWLFVAPLVFYAIAALAHVLARMAGGQGTWFSSRMALFWSLLALAPLWLVQGLAAGFAGPGPLLTMAGIALILAFAVFWGAAIVEAEFGSAATEGR